jgi:hypothetical protein
MGRPTDWEFTQHGRDLLELVEKGRAENYLLDEDALELFERHIDLFVEFPNSSTETFEASEYDLNSSLLRALRESGLLVREEKNVGAPDVWSLSERASRIQTFVLL